MLSFASLAETVTALSIHANIHQMRISPKPKRMHVEELPALWSNKPVAAGVENLVDSLVCDWLPIGL